MKRERINEGDKVRVFWENINYIEGEVLYIPCDTGDSWTIKNGDKLYNVGLFCLMEKI